MEGRVDPGVKNYLADKRSLHERVEIADVFESLTSHPGWVLMDEIVSEMHDRGEERLQQLALKRAMSTEVADAIDFAQRRGVQNGLVFHRDVVASVLDSAKTAAEQLKRTAALDESAERV